MKEKLKDKIIKDIAGLVILGCIWLMSLRYPYIIHFLFSGRHHLHNQPNPSFEKFALVVFIIILVVKCLFDIVDYLFDESEKE